MRGVTAYLEQPEFHAYLTRVQWYMGGKTEYGVTRSHRRRSF